MTGRHGSTVHHFQKILNRTKVCVWRRDAGPPTGRGPDEAQRERFVERFGSALTAAGMQRLPSRVFACLLAHESGRMTAAELGEALAVSPASVSGAVRSLQQVRMIHREREPGTPPGRLRRGATTPGTTS